MFLLMIFFLSILYKSDSKINKFDHFLSLRINFKKKPKQEKDAVEVNISTPLNTELFFHSSIHSRAQVIRIPSFFSYHLPGRGF